MELELEDIEVLTEALDALEEKAMSEGLIGGLLGAMLSGSREQAKEILENEISDAREKGNVVKESVTLVRAKLIQMKRRMLVSAASDFMRSGRA